VTALLLGAVFALCVWLGARRLERQLPPRDVPEDNE
jgi:hypothetical protein